MTPLSDHARALLDAAQADPPRLSPGQRSRLKASVLKAAVPGAALAVGALAEPAVAAAAPLAAKGLLGSALVVNLLAGGAAVLVGAGATWAVMRPDATTSMPAMVAPVPAPVAAHAPIPPPPEVELVVPAPAPAVAVAPVVVATPKPSVAPSVPAQAEVETPEVPRAAPSRPTPEDERRLRDELEVLSVAMRAADAARWAEVLDALARYEVRFPQGALRVEARTLRVLALCGSGREDDARALAAGLRAEAKGSPVLTRLDASCAP